MIRSTSRSVLAGLVVVGGLVLAGCGAGQVAQTARQQSTVDGQQAQVGPIAIRNVALEYPSTGVYERGADARLRMVVVNGGASPDVLTSVSSTVASDVTISEGTSAGATGSATPEPAGSESTSGPATFSPSPTPTGTASGTPTGMAEPQSSVSAGSGAPSQSASGSGASASPIGSATAGGSPTPSATAENAQVQIPPNGYVSFTGDGPSVLLTGLTQQLYPAQSLTVTLTFRSAGSVTMTVAVSSPAGEISPAPTVTVEPDSESEG